MLVYQKHIPYCRSGSHAFQPGTVPDLRRYGTSTDQDERHSTWTKADRSGGRRTSAGKRFLNQAFLLDFRNMSPTCDRTLASSLLVNQTSQSLACSRFCEDDLEGVDLRRRRKILEQKTSVIHFQIQPVACHRT